MLRSIALPLAFLGLVSGQFLPSEDCPLLGPAFSSEFDLDSSAEFAKAKAAFPQIIDSLFESGQINKTGTSFSIDVFSTVTKKSVYNYRHEAPALNGSLTTGKLDDGTIFRVGSVSKLFTVYALLARGGSKILDDPVTKYLPELGGNALNGNGVDKIIWEDITVGALASQESGAGSFPSQFICGEDPAACSIPDFLTHMKNVEPPITAPWETPAYSDAGFGVLGRVVERVTGLPYNRAIREVLSGPLDLHSTWAVKPIEKYLNALIVPGTFAESSWGFDNQVSAPSGGIYSSNADLRNLGISILNHKLLAPAVTRQWMKPRAHTSTYTASVGAPWEISRLSIPVSPGSKRSRISDLYTKLGGQVGYGTIFALSPDHSLGFSILIAGAESLGDRWPLRSAVGETFIPAAEYAASENAASKFAGVYVSDTVPNSNMTLTVDADRPGLGIKSVYINSTELISNFFILGSTLAPSDVSVRAYPTGQQTTVGSSVRSTWRTQARKVGAKSARTEVEGGSGMFDLACAGWLSTDTTIPSQIGGNQYGLDELILETVDGRVESVMHRATEVSFKRQAN